MLGTPSQPPHHLASVDINLFQALDILTCASHVGTAHTLSARV